MTVKNAMAGYEVQGAQTQPASAVAPDVPVTGRRRQALALAARLLPGLTGRFLAGRYMSSPSYLDPEKTRREARLLPLGDDMAVLRYPATGKAAATRRVLIVPGHDGHARQFVRLVASLRRSGAEVDLLVLPGHLREGRTRCGLVEIVRAIHQCGDSHGPYDAVAAHCVSASGLLFAMAEGFSCPRFALISTPVDLMKLMRLGATQYGISGRCLAAFERRVSQLCGPYRPDTPWRSLVEARTEPALVLHARHDFAAPSADARDLAQALPKAQLDLLEQGDHNSILGMTSAIRSLTEFLTRP